MSKGVFNMKKLHNKFMALAVALTLICSMANVPVLAYAAEAETSIASVTATQSYYPSTGASSGVIYRGTSSGALYKNLPSGVMTISHCFSGASYAYLEFYNSSNNALVAEVLIPASGITDEKTVSLPYTGNYIVKVSLPEGVSAELIYAYNLYRRY